MTVTLTYDSTLARVRITADGMGAADVATVERSIDQTRWEYVRGGAEAPVAMRADVRELFGTPATNGWSPADTGQTWTATGGAAADYSEAGGLGLISAGSVNVLRHMLIDVGSPDVELLCDSILPVTPTGAAISRWHLVRATDTGNYYVAILSVSTGNAVTLAIQSRVAGVLSGVLGNGSISVGTHTPGAAWRVRCRASGPTLLAKAWPASAAEPAGWQVWATDTSLTTGNLGGVANRLETGNTNTLPVVISHDNVMAGPPVVALDDYEFVAGRQNFYRIRGVESRPIEYVGAGAAVGADNASLTPTAPAGLLPGDTKIIFAAIRNSGTGTVNTPAQWEVMRTFGNITLLRKPHVAGDTSPLVTFSGGAAGDTTTAQMAAVRRADPNPVTGTDQLNSSAQDIAYPGLTMPEDDLLALLAVWKQDDWTAAGASTPPGWTEIGDAPSTPGNDQGIAWDLLLQGAKANVPTGTITITGGAAAISRAMLLALRHAAYLNEQTASTTPVLNEIWLKSVTRPFLNRPVTVVDWSPEERPSRNGGYPAVGRTLEIAVTDVAGGLVFDLDLHVANQQDAQTLDYIRASGDILFLHTPLGCEVPGGHLCVDTSSARRPRARGSSRVFTLPVRQCAAPGPDVVGTTVTWQTVLNLYPTWAALLADNPTWAQLLARVAPPSEVIVP